MATPVQLPTASVTEVHTQRGAQMRRLGRIVRSAAVFVLLICIYSFLVGNSVFKGRFDNDAIGWYILAKGVFCSLALYLLFKVLEALPTSR